MPGRSSAPRVCQVCGASVETNGLCGPSSLWLSKNPFFSHAEVHDQAGRLVGWYRAELKRNPLVALVDDNPWAEVTVGETLGDALQKLAANLEP